ncbi:conserved hypothetical protein [Rhodobacteraceae bacterium KLH11]|nr:conserved hypothetical protein [Rhodobacteraceae bacterium KLH11]
MQLPDHLPDFTDPPLDEVVLGVQFAPVPSYTSVYAMEIWELFKESFPKVLEQPILEPQFETFGGLNVQTGPKIQFGSPPVGSRLWFLSNDENHLLQFQPDRFLTNWRRQPNPQPYPRYEGIAASFLENLKKLEAHFADRFAYKIDINQAEIGYINVIPVDDFSEASDWFRMWNGAHLNTEALNASFNEVITDQEGKPLARLRHDLQSVFSVDGKSRAFRLSLTYKGKPAGSDLVSAMEFISGGREASVEKFDEITTETAHRIWGKQA